MFRELGIPFSTLVANVDETPIEGETPNQLVERLAELKAKAIIPPNSSDWVIAADTVVSLNGKVLGKPLDKRDAYRMLSELSGNSHEVWGGFCLFNQASSTTYIEACVSKVEFCSINALAIREYIESGEPMDKAGSYAIQGKAGAFVKRIEGSHSNIIGLPLAEVIAAFATHSLLEPNPFN
ncbi:MAG: septum formation protein Maf [Bdellovibrionales bacterium]|nr:septum formation protein Maf [Bdellovibrionales bacterium]